jgi:hypothetical protein
MSTGYWQTTGYYGLIAYDNPNGGTHQRLWESQTYTERDMAYQALVAEFATGNYDGIVGISSTVMRLNDGGK